MSRATSLQPISLDALHVPADAGEHAAGLEAILRRIPPGWGRWISTGPGWYLLLVELDRAIAALVPGYEVHQVKEKLSTLRYYWDLPRSSPADRVELDDAESKVAADGGAPAEGECVGREAHTEDPSHHAAERLREQVGALVDAAVARSALTREICGATPAVLAEYKTLCPTCAASRGCSVQVPTAEPVC